jgi:hypothetical protein
MKHRNVRPVNRHSLITLIPNDIEQDSIWVTQGGAVIGEIVMKDGLYTGSFTPCGFAVENVERMTMKQVRDVISNINRGVTPT